MEVISSARSTILSSFSLEERCRYEGQQNDTTDFKILDEKGMFCQINKKNGLEFIHIKVNENQMDKENLCEKTDFEFFKLRRMKCENLYCITPVKTYQIGLGLSNGEIRVLDYRYSEYFHKFPAETSKQSVLSLDYSDLDENLAAVYEDGSVSLFSLKTKVKLENFNLDGNVTLAKFHPKKRFRLGLVSYKGSLFVYDIHSNRTIFQAIEAHTAPCRDIAMSISQVDLFYTAGYDSVINIYDVRRKVRSQQIKCRYPLSTITVSECGVYCCTGNLKGELLSFDLRNPKRPLYERQLHDSAVIRVAFISPKPKSIHTSLMSKSDQTSSFDQKLDTKSSSFKNELISKERRDSFFDYIEFPNFLSNNGVTENTNFVTTRKVRESFDWEQLSRKPEFDRLSTYKYSISNKRGISGDLPSLNQSQQSNSDKNESTKSSNFHCSIFRDSNILTDINEGNSSNNCPMLEAIENISGIVAVRNNTDRSSTPNNLVSENNFVPINQANDNIETSNINLEILKQLKDLKVDLNKKFDNLENELKYNAEINKWNIYTQNFNFWNKQRQVNSDICDALNFLLHSDNLFQDYAHLKEENEQLKSTLENLTKQIESKTCSNCMD